MQAHPLEVAVEGHHVARLGQVEHQLDLFGIAVARGVHGRVGGRYHVAADVVEAVDRLVDRALVARHGRRREHDRVPVAQLYLGMVAIGHPSQRAQRLALGSGRDDHDAIVGEVFDLAHTHQLAVGHLDVIERASDADVLAHRAPDERNLAIQFGGRVDDLLHAMDVRREARHHDAPLAAREDLLEMRPDDRLRGREARAIDIRGVSAEQQHPLAPEFCQARHVGRRPVDGRLVELVVAGDQYRPEVGPQRNRARVGDRMGHVDHLHRERPELEHVCRSDLVELDVSQLVLVELGARHRHRQRSSVDRWQVRRGRARAGTRAAHRCDPRGRA